MAIEIEHTLTKCWVTVTEPHTFLEHPAYYAGKDNDPHYPVPAKLIDDYRPTDLNEFLWVFGYLADKNYRYIAL